VNNHLVEDELARDMKLAQQIALASASSTTMVGFCRGFCIS